MWYVIQTQTGREQELTESIERVLTRKWVPRLFCDRAGMRLAQWPGNFWIYQKPLFPSYVIADTDTPEEFFLVLKRVPKLSKLLRTDCEFWSIREEEKKLLCRMMGRIAADVDEINKRYLLGKSKNQQKAASAGVNEIESPLRRRRHTVP